jgi:pyridoxamine 5'-phosphate oxidase
MRRQVPHTAGNVCVERGPVSLPSISPDRVPPSEGIVAVVIGEKAARLRLEYESEGLTESKMADDPITEFGSWFEGVVAAEISEPNAFVLATVDSDGRPSARAVLMKDFSSEGLVFYTGMESRKSQAMRANGLAAATFVWTLLHRQVRFEGTVSEVDQATADTYFGTRPRGAQIAAHASQQSTPVASREDLESRFADLDLLFGDLVPRPDHWGGWRLIPDVVEFWQGRPNRFHDRVRYLLDGDSWVKERLAP